ncbi:hypothetical protein J6590_031537 [Homalodisca vitripennis]|nr:hypothetical protein J6590_031537 [Homalodisca vitripennis]
MQVQPVLARLQCRRARLGRNVLGGHVMTLNIVRAIAIRPRLGSGDNELYRSFPSPSSLLIHVHFDTRTVVRLVRLAPLCSAIDPILFQSLLAIMVWSVVDRNHDLRSVVSVHFDTRDVVRLVRLAPLCSAINPTLFQSPLAIMVWSVVDRNHDLRSVVLVHFDTRTVVRLVRLAPLCSAIDPILFQSLLAIMVWRE